MAVVSAPVSVTTTATMLSSDDPNGQTIQFTPPSAIYVGPAGVTTGTGYLLTAGVEYIYDLGADDDLYGVCASGTVVVPVLRIGV
jgi:hypothetical protein